MSACRNGPSIGTPHNRAFPANHRKSFSNPYRLFPRNEGGFCGGACLVFAIVGILIVGAVLWGAYSTYQGAYQMTSAEPRKFDSIPSLAAQNAARLKWQAMKESVQRGEAAEFRFTADDLNAWFFSGGNNADLIPHIRFNTVRSDPKDDFGLKPNDDWLVAEVSVPLDFVAEVPGLPRMKGRYFNGQIAARLAIENGELKIKGLDVEGNGHRLPWLFTGQGYRDTVQQTVESGIRTRFPDGDLWLSRLESFKVENGQIIMKFRGQ
jgi:hypothetical protein